MGIEYRIRYQPADRELWEAFVRRLFNPVSAEGWSAFTVELSDRGIYFCDNDRSDAAAIALRRIIDEALKYGKSVAVEEAG